MKRMIPFLCSLLMLSAAVAGDWSLLPPKPLERVFGDAKALEIVYPTPNAVSNIMSYSAAVGGHAWQGTDRVWCSTDQNGRANYRFDATSIGMSFSEEGNGYSVGDFLSAFPANEDAIDWETLEDDFAKQDAFTEGRAIWVAGAMKREQRILFVRDGATSIVWPLTDGTCVTNVYDVGLATEMRPKRLFWTNAPYNGPAVSVPKNYGYRLCGDMKLMWDSAHTNSVGAPVYDYGVHLSLDNYILSAYAQETEDGSYIGPKGQLVLVYYDSGNCDTYLGHTVFEVSGPAPIYQNVTVGSQVKPIAGGYEPANRSFRAIIQSEQNGDVTSGDVRAPYFLTIQAQSGQFHYKDGYVFAISETEEGLLGAKKAEIYWEEKDAFDVYWPFEESCYHIRWPDCPIVVIGTKEDDRGPGVTIPDGVTVSLLDWKVPGNVVDFNAGDNALRFHNEGRFTLKLENSDKNDLWFVPLKCAYYNNREMFVLDKVRAVVGRELTIPERYPSAVRIDRSLEAYIHESASPARNWNPRLYHYGTTGAEGDPYAALRSSIWLVSAVPASSANDAVNVWWRQSVDFSGGVYEPITLPALPVNYRAEWPHPEEAHEIVIASQLGSAGRSMVTAGTCGMLVDKDATVQCPVLEPRGDETSLMASLWVNPATEADPYGLLFRSGRLLTVSDKNGADLCAIDIDWDNSRSAFVCSAVGTDISFPIASNRWTQIAVELNAEGAILAYTNRVPVNVIVQTDSEQLVDNGLMLTVGAKQVGDMPNDAPCRVAVDEIAVGADGFDGGIRQHYSFNEDTYITRFGNRYFSSELGDKQAATTGLIELLEPGAPQEDDGVLREVDGIAPRLYYNNERGTVGFNLNEEHAFVAQEDGGYVAWALRCDLNTEDSPPIVLAEYNADGVGAMKLFSVCWTNELYGFSNMVATAGEKLPLFRPFDLLPTGPSTNTWADAGKSSIVTSGVSMVAHKDCYGDWWARRDGYYGVHYMYETLEGFAFPWRETQTGPGETVGWNNLMGLNQSGKSASALDALVASPDGIPRVTGDSDWRNCSGTLFVGQVLAKAEAGLPEVFNAKTMAVTYPNIKDEIVEGGVAQTVSKLVKLIDPTVRREVEIEFNGDIEGEYGFRLGNDGDCYLRKGMFYFRGVPPVIGERFFLDTTSAGAGKAHLVLIGQMVEDAAAGDYLLVNSMTADDRDQIIAIVDKENGKYNAWKNAVDALYAIAKKDVEPSVQIGETDGDIGVEIDYSPADHYALVGTFGGPGYVTIIENDGPAAKRQGLPVSMHVLYVTNSLYAGRLVVLDDKTNVLSENLDVYYSAGLGASADDYDFTWVKRAAPADGKMPERPRNESADIPDGWAEDSTQEGTVARVGGNGRTTKLKDLVNTYWTVHYTPKDDDRKKQLVSEWSQWSQPTLAEGWIQRVLNALTPFAQRLADLYDNPAEMKMTIPAQIGAPWKGDVALNNDNLTKVGLMELYRTILNRAESLSTRIEDYSDPYDEFKIAANKQLLEAVARLADFDLLLGDEAYSDAKNPLIGSADGQAFPGSVFSFANQVPSLLDEELALLRGRTTAVAPLVTEYPFYNRLMWNYTKGITQGEVAYVNNYNIISREGVNTATTAAEQYPQGHGDAYGHYLSGVTEFYRLLRNPNFRWGNASMMEMLIAQKVVNMDYEEEDKFAEAAYKLARTGVDVVDLTARKQWRDNLGDVRSGYFDDASVKNPVGISQAFGYGEAACRTGYGALCNWAVANTLLPQSEETAVRHFKDESIACITRRNCSSLAPLAATVAEVENKLNHVDMGLNPLGLSQNAVPFDINPKLFEGTGAVEGQSHYDQIRTRVQRALDNAQTTLNNAQVYGSRIAQIQREEADLSAEAEEMERTYERQLIALYGRPYAGDIGPGKCYEQGYVGPDLYHYMYMDLDEYGLSNLASYKDAIVAYSFKYRDASGNVTATAPESMAGVTVERTPVANMSFSLTADGLIAKPENITGMRGAEGSIQAAYRDFLTAYVKLIQASGSYDTALDRYVWKLEASRQAFGKISTLDSDVDDIYDAMQDCYRAQIGLDCIATTLSGANEAIMAAWEIVTDWQADPVAGLATTVPVASAAKISVAPAAYVAYFANMHINTATKVASSIASGQALIDSVSASKKQLEYDTYARDRETLESLISVCGETWDAAYALQNAYTAALAAQQVFRTRLEEASALLEEREAKRKVYASKATTARYADMYARIERNTALTKYTTAFDVAQRYVFELAKVYDYETGLLSSDQQSGAAFLGETIATRALGSEGSISVASGTDGGLWDIVGRMDGNWQVLKTRLGANNSDQQEKWFSLRYSNFRISPDATADAAWRKELENCWREDVFADGRVARYCQRPENAAGVVRAVPGFVIPFKTSVNEAENFFGRSLLGGESAYSSSDYATRILSAGVDFTGYAELATVDGLAAEPNVYLVPTGRDYMRAPAGTHRETIAFNVVDQVLPLPYAVGSTQLDDDDWVATVAGLDGTVDSFATIRRHSTLPVGPRVDATTRLVGRSVWNDGWILVIPATAMHGNADTAKRLFLQGVTDIRLGLRTYSRQGN